MTTKRLQVATWIRSFRMSVDCWPHDHGQKALDRLGQESSNFIVAEAGWGKSMCWCIVVLPELFRIGPAVLDQWWVKWKGQLGLSGVCACQAALCAILNDDVYSRSCGPCPVRTGRWISCAVRSLRVCLQIGSVGNITNSWEFQIPKFKICQSLIRPDSQANLQMFLSLYYKTRDTSSSSAFYMGI